jgi:monoamine oxidase
LPPANTIINAGGLSVLVLEANSRIGGRTYTNTKTFSPVPVDLGGQWFHQSKDDALLNYARSHGYSTLVQTPEVFYNGTVFQPARASPSRWKSFSMR